MGQTKQSILINAPLDKVWDAIKDFQKMDWAPNVISKIEMKGDIPGNKPGSRRILNDVFHETLAELDEENKTFAYSIDDGPSPISKDDVSNYIGRVRVSSATNGGETLVEWTSIWEKNDEAAYEFCHSIYVAL
ncbi:MAG: SRPBCC family protein, partial [candidate division Zixibacteria bacterium]|nr:SRPBCC family protein [candidate division Zixibacteria bacterium]